MICKCGGKLGVIDSRAFRPDEVVRKRKCKVCGAVIFTSEKEVGIIEGNERFRELYRKMDEKKREKRRKEKDESGQDTQPETRKESRYYLRE